MIPSRPLKRQSRSRRGGCDSEKFRERTAATGICSGKTGILPEIDDRVLPMADSISPSPVAPEAGMAPNTPGPERADLRPENIQDAVIRLAGNSQDGIQTAGAFLARLAGRSDQ